MSRFDLISKARKAISLSHSITNINFLLRCIDLIQGPRNVLSKEGHRRMEETISEIVSHEASILRDELNTVKRKKGKVKTVEVEVTKEVKVGMTSEEIKEFLFTEAGQALLEEHNREKKIREIAAKIIRDIENSENTGSGSSSGGQKKGNGSRKKAGHLEKMINVYTNENPEFMETFKELLDKAYTIEFINGKFVVKSIYTTNLENTVFGSVSGANRRRKELATYKLQDDFGKEDKRLKFNELTEETLQKRFAKVM